MSLIKNLTTKKLTKNSQYPRSCFSQSVDFGQRPSHCAGVSAAILIAYHSGRIEGGILPDDELIHLFREINANSIDLYKTGHDNSLKEDAVIVDNFIELAYIRDALTVDKRNILKVNQDLSIVFETPLSLRFDENGEAIPLVDYKEIWEHQRFPEVFRHYMSSRTNAVLFSDNHYITILVMGTKFIIIDSIPNFALYWYRDMEDLLTDLTDFVGVSKFTLHHARVFGDNDFDIILDNIPNRNVTQQIDDSEIINLDSDEEVQTFADEESNYDEEFFSFFNDDDRAELNEELAKLSDNEEEEDDTAADNDNDSDNNDSEDDDNDPGNLVAVKGAIDPKTLTLLDNHEEIRNYLENVIKDRDANNGTKYELAGEGDTKCRVIDCMNKKHPNNTQRFCFFHVKVATLCLTLTNGRICTTPGCDNKCDMYSTQCRGCLANIDQHKIVIANRTRNDVDRWPLDKVKSTGKGIAVKYAEMVKLNKKLKVYFGITLRDLILRLREHYKNGKNFDLAVLEIEVPNLISLAELEYYTILYFSELVETKHIVNKAPGGEYYLPDMARKGVLYVLLFTNAVGPNDVNPVRDFSIRRGPRFRRFPILTEDQHIVLPKFNKVLHISDIMKLLGYDLDLTIFERAHARTEGMKCKHCTYRTLDENCMERHNAYMHRGLKYPCHLCSHVSTRNAHLRSHLKKIHNFDLPIADPKKYQTEYPCEYDNCDEVFKSSAELYKHRLHKHKGRTHKCDRCGSKFYEYSDLRSHMLKLHGVQLKSVKELKPKTEFQCCKCKDFFKNQRSLFTHLGKIHKMKNITITLRKMKEEEEKEKKDKK